MSRFAAWLAVDAVRRFQALDLDASETDAQARRGLSRSLSHAALDCSFYLERLRAAGIEPADPLLKRDPGRVLAALRPVSKDDLRQAGAAVLAGGRVRPGWLSSLSSGSTGEPFRVYYTPRAWATLKYLVKLRARRACGMRTTDRVAILDTVTPSRHQSRLGQHLRYIRLSVLQTPSAVAEQLAAFAPDIIYGLPSALAEAVSALRLQSERLRVRAVFTSGELLAQATRTLLAGMFQAPVYDVYGTSETKEIAWQCPEGGMHVNADVVHLEVLDDSGQSMPPAREGNLVVTSLVNRAMPLIRYYTGDRGALLPGTCACGRSSPLLGVLAGRSADVLVLRDGQRISPYALTCALERIDGVVRYQVSQLDPSRVRVRVIAQGAANRETLATQMRMALCADVAPFLAAEVEFVDRLPTGPRAKFRVVEPLAAPSPMGEA